MRDQVTTVTIWKVEHSQRVLEIYERDNGICGICHRPVNLDAVYCGEAPTIDHILAISRGGTDDAGNVQLAHASCNTRKSTFPAHLFGRDGLRLERRVGFMLYLTASERRALLEIARRCESWEQSERSLHPAKVPSIGQLVKQIAAGELAVTRKEGER